MHWLWLIVIVIAFSISTYNIFHKEHKLRNKARSTHSVDDLISYIDISSDKPIDFAIFVIGLVLILDQIGVIG